MTVKKSFGTAFVLWFFLGGLGAHRIYVEEKPLVFLWYWLAVVFTLSIILWVDLFTMKSKIEKDYEERRMKEAYYNNAIKG